MTLSNQDKSTLKAVGQKMKDDAVLGDAGLTEGFASHLDVLLNKHELIKIRFQLAEGSMRKQLAQDLSEALGAQLVSVVGRTMLIYRANPTLPKDMRLLPNGPTGH